MKTYNRMTLGELITAIRALPDESSVTGIDNSVHSYRGYYERNAIDRVSSATWNAEDLAADLAAEIGKDIHGYKGGDYSVDEDELVYLAGYDETGPCIIGLAETDIAGHYEPIVLSQDYHF